MLEMRKLTVIVCLASLIGFSNLYAQENDQPPNFIVLIGDDMAIETLSCYKVGENPAVTPNLDQLCHSGVRFDNFWAQPACSPTRATILTGQFGFANGVGAPVTGIQGVDWKVPDQTNTQGNAMARNAMAMGGNGMAPLAPNPNNINPSIPSNAKTFVQALKAQRNYQTAAVGKWHLANDTNGRFDHPAVAGFDHYAGGLRAGNIISFEGWSKTIDGSEPFGKTGYAMSDKIDDSIAWLELVDETKPWLLWVAFNAPHSPFHKPPVELLHSDEAKALNNEGPIGGEDPTSYYRAMVEAIDSETARLLSTLDDETLANTYVIFIGDNGTPDETVTAPFKSGKAKVSLYQGGVNTPLMIAGPGIEAGRTSKSLANSVDLFATIMDLSNISLDDAKPSDQPFHSVSLVPILTGDANTQVRDFAYADIFGSVRGAQLNSRTIRNDEYKLIQHLNNNTEELYKLTDDPYENSNLLASELNTEQQENYDSLKGEIDKLTSE